MTVPVKLEEVIDCLQTQSEETHYYLDTQSGEILLFSNDQLRAVENEEDDDLSPYPESDPPVIVRARQLFDAPGQFIELPDKWEINKYAIMEEFCLAIVDTDISAQMFYAIKGKGAFGRFRDKLHRYHLENQWYRFQHDALKRIALEWCQDNEIPFTE
jgi:hypothetical protein